MFICAGCSGPTEVLYEVSTKDEGRIGKGYLL